jgi:monoamine oxidase
LAFLLPGLEAAYPGVTATRNGSVERFHWPTYPFTLASYRCFRPGQWTTIAGSEILPVDRLFFAGEHTSYNFQGYMNGGAETGRRVAEAILAKSFFGKT